MLISSILSGLYVLHISHKVGLEDQALYVFDV